MANQQSLPPELQLGTTNSSDYGPLYLKLILECWCSPQREDELGPNLRVVIDDAIFWVVNDMFDDDDDPKDIATAERLMADFTSQTLKKMLAIANRKIIKAKRGRYQGIETTDLKLAAIMSILVSLYDQAREYIENQMTEPVQPLPKPNGKNS